ncbi:hypothetical protein HCN44_009513 [Aphidius gifuensis]|uniref:Lipocalin/cytosolic fatty-acid binding domain-containing protein n=2 Tax=Aphidius gifuensis TaxID=684658 RepID=A0A834Y2E0_APHGI|nr:hypothetical protein HCN44_009513 [Aphidius gifuensis]
MYANTLAQIPIFEDPQISPMENFDKSQYIGDWYEIARIPNIFELGQKCSTFTYKLNERKGSLFEVITTKSEITNKIHKQIAINSPARDQPASVFNVYYAWLIKIGKLTILSTDYKNYAVKTLVTPLIGTSRLQMAWILSRNPTLSSEYHQLAEDVLRANNISPATLKPTNQIDC